jgi:hypothetical protein
MTPQDEATFAEVCKKRSELQGKDPYELIAIQELLLNKHKEWLDSLTADVEKLKQEIQELRGNNNE